MLVLHKKNNIIKKIFSDFSKLIYQEKNDAGKKDDSYCISEKRRFTRRINSIKLLKALLTIEQLVVPAVAAQILTIHGPIQMSYKTGMSLK